MTDLAFLSARELALKLRRREVSARDLVDHHIARIERLDGALNAVVVRDFERARDRARAADAALATGTAWGPLHGVPMTVKESFDLPGLPTTRGLEALRHNVASRPAVAVQRLLDAGAIVLGKTNVPSSLADWQSFNPIYGTTNNPWDTARTPGGSSGGSAVALAEGFSALELGSDIGASIRNPAHHCGVWGHKPTWGVVPLEGQQSPGDVCIDAIDIAVAGPMARSAHDLTLAMDLLAGSPPQAFGPLGWGPLAWRDAGVPARRLRVAIVTDDPVAEVDASVRDAIVALADFLRAEGLTVGAPDAERPVDSAEAWEVCVHLLRAATGARLGDEAAAAARAEAARLAPDSQGFAAWHWRAHVMSHREWVRYDQRRARLRQQWAAFFDRWDLLVCPVATTAACPHMQSGASAGSAWCRSTAMTSRARRRCSGPAMPASSACRRRRCRWPCHPRGCRSARRSWARSSAIRSACAWRAGWKSTTAASCRRRVAPERRCRRAAPSGPLRCEPGPRSMAPCAGPGP